MYPLKSSNLFNFREGRKKGRCPKGGGGCFFSGEGAPTGNITPLMRSVECGIFTG